MADNTFPLVLAVKEDGSVNAAMAGFEDSVRVGTMRAGGHLDTFGQRYRRLRDDMAKTVADPLGLNAQLRSLSNSPIQRAIDQQLSSANALAAQQARLAQSHGLAATSAGAQRAAYVGLGQQLQDTVIQAQMGTSAFTILTQQGGQAAYAFSNFGGKVGAVATFLAGWQGAVILAGVALAGNLLPALFRTNDELDEQLDKLRENASKAELAEKAKRAFANTEAGAAEGVRELTAEIQRQNDALLTNAERLNIQAKQQLEKYSNIRPLVAGELTTAQAELTRAQESARSGLTADPAVAAVAQAALADAEKKVAAIEERLRNIDAKIGEAQGARVRTQVQILGEAVQRRLNPVSEIERRYNGPNGLITQLENRAVAEGGVTAEIAAQVNQLTRAKAAEIERANAAKQTSKAVAEIGRTISLSEAKGIVASIGGTVTSGLRSREHQAQLYAKYQAGTGPLAARPGHSNHELGQALDIAKTEGITIGKIRDAFRARGVQVTELLDEGRHFHVAWKASATASREANEAAREAAKAQRELEQSLATITARFDPAAAAAQDYAKSIGEIDTLVSKGLITPGTGFEFKMKALRAQQAQQAADFDQAFRNIFGEGINEAITEWNRGLTAGAVAASEELTGGVRAAVNEMRYAASGIADLLGIQVRGPAARLLQNGGIEGQAGDIAAAVAKALRTIEVKFDGKSEARLANVIAAAGYGQVGASIYSGISGRPGNGTLGAAGGILGGELGKQIGTSIATSTSSSLVKMLGGAAGPLGAIAGGILGNVIGGLFRTVKYGTATLSGAGAASLNGNSGTVRGAAGTAAGSVQSGLARLAERLGGTVGAFDVMIGQYDGKWRVRDSASGWNGQGGLNFKGNSAIGLTDFGEDAEAAIRYAIANAVKDGAIQGLRAGSQRLLGLGDDIEAQLEKVLQFEGVFAQLKQIKDPIGAAAEAVEKEFANLRKVFDDAGASAEERAQLEELYSLKRAEAIKQAQESTIGQLRDLLDDLKTGDNGLNLRTRQQNILSTLSPLIAAIESGGKVDQADFTAAARTYLDIQRELYGSTNPYFDALKQITDLTNKAIENSGAGANVASLLSGSNQGAIAAAAAAGGSAPSTSTVYVDTASIVTAVDRLVPLLDGNNARLDLISKQLAQQGQPMVLQLGAGGGTAYVNALRNA